MTRFPTSTAATSTKGVHSMQKLFISAQTRLAEFRAKKDEGATMVEYGLIVAFIALVALVGVTIFGDKLSEFFNDTAEKLP